MTRTHRTTVVTSLSDTAMHSLRSVPLPDEWGTGTPVVVVDMTDIPDGSFIEINGDLSVNVHTPEPATTDDNETTYNYTAADAEMDGDQG